MRVFTRLIIVGLAVATTYFMEVESRRHHSKHSGKVAADAVMRSWQHMLKKWQGPSYKYWHHRQDSNGNWHARKYGNSDSYSGSDSRSSESDSGSKSNSRSESYSKSGSDSNSRERHHSKRHSKLVIAEAFVLFGKGYGCQNVTAYQTFLASYTTGEGRPANLSMNTRHKEKDELLKEMSKLASQDLAKGKGAEEQCSETCSNSSEMSQEKV